MASKKDCPDGTCPVVGKKENLVKATDLPLVGNPYPPRDVIQSDAPGYLQNQVRAMRTTLLPILSPIHSAYEQTSDFISIGVAHSQSAMQRLAENQSSVVNASIIAGSGLFGLLLARRKGFFKKVLYGSVFFAGASIACYPKDAEEKGRMLVYIVKNKLPVVAQQQYEKITKGGTSQEGAPKKTE